MRISEDPHVYLLAVPEKIGSGVSALEEIGSVGKMASLWLAFGWLSLGKGSGSAARYVKVFRLSYMHL